MAWLPQGAPTNESAFNMGKPLISPQAAPQQQNNGFNLGDFWGLMTGDKNTHDKISGAVGSFGNAVNNGLQTIAPAANAVVQSVQHLASAAPAYGNAMNTIAAPESRPAWQGYANPGMNDYQRYQSDSNSALERARNAIGNTRFNRMDNPWADGNAGLQSVLDQNRGQYGGGLAQAINDHRRNLAQRGVTQDSGLAQNQDLQTRLMAAKGLSSLDTQARGDNYNRQAAFDTEQNARANQFDQWKAQAQQSGSFQELGALQNMMSQANAQRMLPAQIEGARLANENQRTANQYQGQGIQQALQGGDITNAYNKKNLDWYEGNALMTGLGSILGGAGRLSGMLPRTTGGGGGAGDFGGRY